MKGKAYFDRIEEKIREKEKELGRELSLDEQDELKFQAMTELWVDSSNEVRDEDSREV